MPLGPEIALLSVLLAAGLPGRMIAQQASPPSVDLSIDRAQRRPVVLPKPSPEQTRTDADAAIDDYVARRNMGRVVKETAPVGPPSRPDLDDDVTGGIQTQRLNDALRGR
jgi:hypothetical protein